MLIASLLLALAPPGEAPRAAAPPVTTVSGLRFRELEPGAGRSPLPGDAVLVSYEGRLADGTIFDSSAEPVGMAVDAVVPGFREALLRMRKGGRYRFWIPPALAYGAEGGGPIPPDAELDFTVTLHAIGRPVGADVTGDSADPQN